MKDKKRILIILISVIGAVGVAAIVYYTMYHRWNDADCTTPKTCTICGKTEGMPLGHDWTDATCEDPKTCVVCGETEGEPLGHDWANATCIAPKTCTRCGKTEGDALGHELVDVQVLKEPTCTEEGQQQGTCERCHETITEDVDKLAHTPGDWEVKTDYKISPQALVTPGEEVQKCTGCGKELESREYTVELTTSQRNAVLKAYQEVQLWHCGRDYLINDVLVVNDGYSVEDATFAVDHLEIDWDEQAVLYAKEYGRGESKTQLTEMMIYYGFNQEQINRALAEVGY